MKFLIENRAIIVVLFIIVIASVSMAYNFVKMPTATQIKALKEWLKYAVAMAEKELKSGTGQLKLRMVYDMALSKFSWLGSLISFEDFSGYVDEALVWFNSQLESNSAVKTLVKGGEHIDNN